MPECLPGTNDWPDSREFWTDKRVIVTGKAEALFGFRARIPFEEGRRRTIKWYLAERARLMEREKIAV